MVDLAAHARMTPVSEHLDDTFSALADPTRRGVIELLRERPLRAGELAAAFEMSAPAMSRHLRVLRKNGLVEEEGREDDARVRVYRLKPERFAEMRDWLEEVEAYWGDQLAAFKSHAEGATKARVKRAEKVSKRRVQ